MEIGTNNQRRVLFGRILGSVAVFTVFVIMAVSFVMTQDTTLKWSMFLPLILSMLVLPRTVDADDLSDEAYARTKLWLSYVRVAYFLLALFVLLGLPELLHG